MTHPIKAELEALAAELPQDDPGRHAIEGSSSRVAKRFNVYEQHKGSNIKMPQESSLQAVKRLAEAAARAGNDSFYRVFEDLGGGREQFVTSFSVLDGKVREHQDVSFPRAHFASKTAAGLGATAYVPQHGHFDGGPQGLAKAEKMSKREVADAIANGVYDGSDEPGANDINYWMKFPKAILDCVWGDTYGERR